MCCRWLLQLTVSSVNLKMYNYHCMYSVQSFSISNIQKYKKYPILDQNLPYDPVAPLGGKSAYTFLMAYFMYRCLSATDLLGHKGDTGWPKKLAQ